MLKKDKNKNLNNLILKKNLWRNNQRAFRRRLKNNKNCKNSQNNKNNKKIDLLFFKFIHLVYGNAHQSII